MTTTGIILLIVAVLIVAALAGFFGSYLMRERRSRRLRSRFGPEYDHTLRETGSRPAAEDALARREERVERIHVRSLSRADHERFAEEWHDVQARFVDDPPGSIDAADQHETRIDVFIPFHSAPMVWEYRRSGLPTETFPGSLKQSPAFSNRRGCAT